jgi:hypothetical protein
VQFGQRHVLPVKYVKTPRHNTVVLLANIVENGYFRMGLPSVCVILGRALSFENLKQPKLAREDEVKRPLKEVVSSQDSTADVVSSLPAGFL